MIRSYSAFVYKSIHASYISNSKITRLKRFSTTMKYLYLAILLIGICVTLGDTFVLGYNHLHRCNPWHRHFNPHHHCHHHCVGFSCHRHRHHPHHHDMMSSDRSDESKIDAGDWKDYTGEDSDYSQMETDY